MYQEDKNFLKIADFSSRAVFSAFSKEMADMFMLLPFQTAYFDYNVVRYGLRRVQ